MCYLQLAAVRGDCAALSSVLGPNVPMLPEGAIFDGTVPSSRFDICLLNSAFMLLERIEDRVGLQFRIHGGARQISAEPTGLVFFKGLYEGRETEFFGLLRPGEVLPKPAKVAVQKK